VVLTWFASVSSTRRNDAIRMRGFVIARSEATKQSRLFAQLWIASLRSQ
jgi:hypothetical protein